MQELRPRRGQRALQGGQQGGKIVAVDRAVVSEGQRAEQRPGGTAVQPLVTEA